jgi:hypothetical protein
MVVKSVALFVKTIVFLKKVCKYSRNSFSLEKMLTFTA